MTDFEKTQKVMAIASILLYVMAAGATVWGNESGIHAAAFFISATIWQVGALVVAQIWRLKSE